MSHVQYFNVQGFFNTQNYLQNMGIDIIAGRLLDSDLPQQAIQELETAIRRAEIDSKKGDLTGIMALINTVQDLQDRYHAPADYKCHLHGQPLKKLVAEMCEKPELVKHYKLENFAASLRKPQTVTTTQAKKKVCNK